MNIRHPILRFRWGRVYATDRYTGRLIYEDDINQDYGKILLYYVPLIEELAQAQDAKHGRVYIDITIDEAQKSADYGLQIADGMDREIYKDLMSSIDKSIMQAERDLCNGRLAAIARLEVVLATDETGRVNTPKTGSARPEN